MKYPILTVYSLSILCVAKAISQEIDTSYFESLKIKQKPFFNYKVRNNEKIGCDWNLECRSADIVFYKIDLDKGKHILKLKGRTFSDILRKKDTLGTVMYILTARPTAKKLKSKRNLIYSYSRSSEDINKNNYPYRKGDFQIEIRFNKSERLYFGNPTHYLIEYDIGKLLK